jgi:hypothetical protein
MSRNDLRELNSFPLICVSTVPVRHASPDRVRVLAAFIHRRAGRVVVLRQIHRERFAGVAG